MKTKSVLIIALLVGCTMFFACEGTPLDVNSQNTSYDKFQPTVKTNSNGFTLISAGLHRGKKWTKRQNRKRKKHGRDLIEPCSRSFGICNIKIGKQKNKNVSVRRIKNSSIILSFMEDVGAYEGKVFFSKYDGAFTFPKKIANKLGCKNITIIPDDYITHISEKHPNGYVIVRCKIES